MRLLKPVAVALLSAALAACAAQEGGPSLADRLARAGEALQGPETSENGQTCLRLIGDRMAGMNRICTYDCGQSAAAITIPATDLCPVTLER